MHTRQRLLAVLAGRAPDRVPWVPRLLLWYNARRATGTLPPEWEELSLREVERALGCGTPARDGQVAQRRYESVTVERRLEDGLEVLSYHTPVGSVRQVSHSSETLRGLDMGGRVMEPLLKGPDDYAVWEWVTEHTYWDATYDAYRAYDAEIGEDGLPMVSAGDAPFHWFLLDGAGYEDGYLQLQDYRREVEHLLAVMTEVERDRLWPVLEASPARLLLHGVHHSSSYTPPRMYERYILPYYQAFNPRMQSAGKAVALHADNDTSRIATLIEQAGYDMVECFVTAPMVPFTLKQARETWGTRVIIWGGLPSLLLSPSVPEDEFRAEVHHVLDVVAPGDAFILGVADNVMPDSLIERVAWVSDLLEERGRYPVVPRG